MEDRHISTPAGCATSQLGRLPTPSDHATAHPGTRVGAFILGVVGVGSGVGDYR